MEPTWKEVVEFWQNKAREAGYKHCYEPNDVTMEMLYQQAYNEGHLDGFVKCKASFICENHR